MESSLSKPHIMWCGTTHGSYGCLGTSNCYRFHAMLLKCTFSIFELKIFLNFLRIIESTSLWCYTIPNVSGVSGTYGNFYNLFWHSFYFQWNFLLFYSNLSVFVFIFYNFCTPYFETMISGFLFFLFVGIEDDIRGFTITHALLLN